MDLADDALPVAVLVVDGGAVVGANRAWTELSGLSIEQSRGGGVVEALDPADRQRCRGEMLVPDRNGAVACGDYRLGEGSGQRWTRWWARGVGGGRAVIVVADLTADHQRVDDLARRASHDPLTGLLNREELLDLAERALRDAEHLAVVFVDLDGFKAVNDHGGHRIGDRVLAAVAGRLRDVVGPAGVVGRVGGDEFAVLCHDGPAGARTRQVAERIKAAFSVPLEIDGVRWTVGASLGVAVSPVAGTTPEALIEAADRDMYSARATRVRALTGAAAAPVDELYVVADLRRSLRQVEAFVETHVDDPVSFELLDVAYAARRALAVLEGSPDPVERIPPG